MEAIAMHGAARGSWLALQRLMRCHPFASSGFDPVPLPQVCSHAAAGIVHDPLP